MHGSRSKISSKNSRPYIYDVKFLALLGASYIYDISRLRVNSFYCFCIFVGDGNSHIIKEERAMLRVSKNCKKSGVCLIAWSLYSLALQVLKKFVKCFSFCISINLDFIGAYLET
jgi:hypothetical protein